MKKLLFIIVFLFVSLAVSSQSLSYDVNTIEKRYGKIVNTETSKKIHKKDLKLLLYNPKTSDITLNFGATDNGIGLVVKF